MITTMLDTATIFRREFVARRDLLWAALYIAVLVVVVPYFPFISHWDKTDVRDLSSVGLALGAGLAPLQRGPGPGPPGGDGLRPCTQ